MKKLFREVGSPETGRGGYGPWFLQVGHDVECVGPKPADGLPAGSQPDKTTADVSDEQLVRSIVDRYIGPSTSGVLSFVIDNMSVNNLVSATPRKKRVRDKESYSDSDIDGHSVKGRKILRSRTIDSDSDRDTAGAIVLSDSPKEMTTKVRGRKARSRKLDKLDKLDKLENSFESTRVVFTECPSHLAYEYLQGKDVDEIAIMSEGWLNNMETARFRSKKINGKFSSVLKDRIVCLRSIIRSLVKRIKDTSDVSYLRRRDDELVSQGIP